MARKRMIDPEYWSDEEIGSWSYPARLLYIGLWNFADDEGKFKAHNKLLKSQIFPYDERVNIETLKKEISSKVQWYVVNGSKYGFLHNFLKYQRIDRPTPSKLPTPTSLDEPSTNNQGSLAPNIKEVNIREEKLREGSILPFWDYFLLKTKKKYTLNSERKDLIRKRLSEHSLDDLKRVVDNFVADDWAGRADNLDLIYCIGKQKGKPDNLEKWLNIEGKNEKGEKLRPGTNIPEKYFNKKE